MATMDRSLFKNTTTSRGLLYHYYISPGTKAWLLFLHGFPGSALDWVEQVGYFAGSGYGVIVPDMLGYGGTAKPTDPQLYAPSAICQDVIDILDAEHLQSVIVIGHDLGANITGRLANIHPHRFIAFAFLSVGYSPPGLLADYDTLTTLCISLMGRELYGYWAFFSEEGADKIVRNHADSFFNLFFAADNSLFISHLCPNGEIKKWLLADKTADRASFLTETRYNEIKQIFLNDGFAAPFCWYKVLTSDISNEDAKSIPEEMFTIEKPVFYGACSLDYVAVPAVFKPAVARYCKNATVKDFESSHWIMWDVKEELNQALGEWVESALEGE